ncbi:hypothetical protein KIN20_035023 [Parelaphostrongylus tenuis]|uniref:3-oxo-5alpha-steroid 4-dehydrogenase (NADP(+)) n=1 Tax=Parelaphostrongylus tenuis TaxID=148309 RepID=A0AAD5RAL1_PARTN|nr:hypothetical protein KIN20_035023 [Parelaphostrongylus tenuis]
MFYDLSEFAVIYWLSWLMMLIAAVSFVHLMSGSRVMYGRYSVRSALMIPPRLSWFTQELPSFAIPLYYVFGCRSAAGILILTTFVLHYFNRTFVYSLQLKSGNGTPWYIWLAAVVFCIGNGYLQGSYHGQYYWPANFFSHISTYIGLLIFASGMFINITSDRILHSLRRPGETGYKIPQGGLFEYVSGANFFGEIVEWIGYAIMSQSLPAFAFALLTACNLGPRAIHHHQWYHNKFPNYPKNRKALIPFVL